MKARLLVDMDGVKDEVVPGDRWVFDSAVADAFDDMLARSIPQLDVMRDAVWDVATKHIRPGGFIVDLGCSRGGALEQFVKHYGQANRYAGVDVSEPMLLAARERFSTLGAVVEIDRLDLRRSYPDVGAACVTMAVLTLQFIPINYRQQIMRAVYEHTMPGGAFVLVEKVLGNSARIETLFVELYHSFKESNGYSREAIVRKSAALEGVLVPVTAEMNIAMLRSAGFREVDCFWRWMNFAAWVAIKGD